MLKRYCSSLTLYNATTTGEGLGIEPVKLEPDEKTCNRSQLGKFLGLV